MLRSLGNVLAYPVPKLAFRRLAHGEPDRFRVTVIGGAGGIGQPLSLLLRLHPLVSTLKLYDLKLAKGVAVDLSHIDRPGLTKGFEGKEDLLKALRCTDIVVLAAGMPRKPGQSRDDLFDANACVTAEIADAMGMVSPDAFLAIITNPINSTVPVAAEVLKKRGVYNPALLAGITTLDVVRARKFIADCIFVDPRKIRISVIGGHSGKTIVPLISQIEPSFTGDDADITRITKRIQEAGTEVVEAKGGSGSATLSMAYAAANFVNSLLVAKSDRKEVRDTAYVESCLTPARFFASEVRIGAGGIIDAVPLPELSQYEDQLMCDALPILLEDIKKGQEFGEAYEIQEKKEGECEDKRAVKTPPPPPPPPPKDEECKKKEEPKKDCKKKEEPKKDCKKNEEPKKECKKKEEPKKECKKKEEPKDCKKEKEEPKKDCKKATSPRPKPCDGGGEKKDSLCAELLKQMKNAPCRKGGEKPKEEQSCAKNGGNESEEKDSPCKNSFNPCKGFKKNNEPNSKDQN